MDIDKIIEAYAARHNLRASVIEDKGIRTDKDGWRHHAYRMRLTRTDADDGTRYAITTRWIEGLAFTGSPADRAADILESLVSDLLAYREHADAAEYADAMGYDDDRKAASTWRALESLAPRVEEFFGGADRLDALLDQSE